MKEGPGEAGGGRETALCWGRGGDVEMVTLKAELPGEACRLETTFKTLKENYCSDFVPRE